jgi:hypothetical protein
MEVKSDSSHFILCLFYKLAIQHFKHFPFIVMKWVNLHEDESLCQRFPRFEQILYFFRRHVGQSVPVDVM